MLLSCGDALVDFLPVEVRGRARCGRAGGRWILPQHRRRHGASRRTGRVCRWHLDRSVRPHDRRPRARPRRSTFDMRRAASTRRRWRSSAPSQASRNMPSMTRRRRRETGSIGRARSPSTRSKPSMSDRRRSPTTRVRLRRLRWSRTRGGSVTISFDPNCRPNLVRHKARYVEQMDAFAAAADIVRMSDVDFEFLYGGSDYAGRAKITHRGRRKPRRRDARNQGSSGVASGGGRRSRSRRPP